MNNIVLIGFMGTGKSTISGKLAGRLGWDAIDTDHYIENEENLSVSDIFKLKGELYFRNVESRAIEKIMQGHNQVIATGGGAVLAEENRKNMLNNGFIVALTADANTIIDRVSRDQKRPLLVGDVKQNVLQLLEKRKNAYDFAHLQIDTTSFSIDEITNQILQEFNNYRNVEQQ